MDARRRRPILEAAGIPQPETINGIKQRPMDGVSMAYTWDKPGASVPSKRTTQYFEMFGNRAIYHDGWYATTLHKAFWEAAPRATFENDTWELYNAEEDFSLTNNLAAKHPEKVEALKALFLTEAVKYSVLPLDDRVLERFNASIAGRPDLMGPRTSLTLYEGMIGLSENAFINMKNRSYTITAELEIPKDGAEGVIIAHGGHTGGWSLYVKNGQPKFAYNWLGREMYEVIAPKPLPPGAVTLL
jgi:arylsulfatase